MDLCKASVLNSSDTLSKATEELVRNGTAVIIMNEGVYKGIVDDRHLSFGTNDAAKEKCGSVCVKAPSLRQASSLNDKLNAFLAGHFKALPVFDDSGKLEGLYSRSDFLRDLLSQRLIPDATVDSIMNSPVFTVDYEDKVGAVRRLMKQHDANKLLVLKNGKPFGITSTYDLAPVSMNPKKRRGASTISEVTSVDDLSISSFVREGVHSIEPGKTIADAMKKMADAKISSLTVMSSGKASGVVAATDIFKIVQSLLSDKQNILISGLGEDDKSAYSYISDRISNILGKFASIPQRSASVHVKKGESVYSVKVLLSVDGLPISVSIEGHDLRSAVDALSDELHVVLQKKKEKHLEDRYKKYVKGDIY